MFRLLSIIKTLSHKKSINPHKKSIVNHRDIKYLSETDLTKPYKNPEKIEVFDEYDEYPLGI